MNNRDDKFKASQEQCGAYDPNAIRGIGTQAPKSYYGDEYNALSPEPPTLRQEAEMRVAHHREQADTADRAVAFFCDNPAFDLFVRLVRSGVIQFLVLACLCAALSAQDKPPATHDGIPQSSGQGLVPHQAKPPVIPDALQKTFFKAQSEFAQAQAQAQAAQLAANQAQAVYNEEIKKVQGVCGESYQSQLDKDRFPICAVKPPSAAEPKK
jgi:hypothetical protein